MSAYLGVGVPAYNEADWSWATFTEDGVGLTESRVPKTDRVHLQDLVPTTAKRSTTNVCINKATCYFEPSSISFQVKD